MRIEAGSYLLQVVSVDTIGRYIDQHSVDISVEYYRLSVGRVLSIECRSSIGRYFGRYVSADTVLVSSTLGRYLIDTLPIVCRYGADTLQILGRYLTDTQTKCRLILVRPSRYVSVDMSVVNCPTISYNILLLRVDKRERQVLSSL